MQFNVSGHRTSRSLQRMLNLTEGRHRRHKPTGRRSRALAADKESARQQTGEPLTPEEHSRLAKQWRKAWICYCGRHNGGDRCPCGRQRPIFSAQKFNRKYWVCKICGGISPKAPTPNDSGYRPTLAERALGGVCGHCRASRSASPDQARQSAEREANPEEPKIYNIPNDVPATTQPGGLLVYTHPTNPARSKSGRRRHW